jgi:hypothetical protein
MQVADKFLTILTIGVVGGIIFTVATHPEGVKGFFSGLDSLYSTAVKGTYGAA